MRIGPSTRRISKTLKMVKSKYFLRNPEDRKEKDKTGSISNSTNSISSRSNILKVSHSKYGKATDSHQNLTRSRQSCSNHSYGHLSNPATMDQNIGVQEESQAVNYTEIVSSVKREPPDDVHSETSERLPRKRQRQHVVVKYEEEQCLSECSPAEIKQESESCEDFLTHVKQEMEAGESQSGWQPPNWMMQLTNIMEMRRHCDAPVDTMGCDVISDVTASPQDYRYQVLISLMLSSQTRDEITSAAMHKLRQHGCNVQNILATSDEQLGKLIYPAGFWKKKIVYIKKTSQLIVEKHGGDIPDTLEGLCSLPGVGPKMAHLAMKCAWNVISGIGVDTHVHRISNRLGWTQKPTREPEQTRVALEDWLPREYWSSINHLLVGFGQQTCLPIGPKCNTCLNKHICPVGLGIKPASSPKKKK